MILPARATRPTTAPDAPRAIACRGRKGTSARGQGGSHRVEAARAPLARHPAVTDMTDVDRLSDESSTSINEMRGEGASPQLVIESEVRVLARGDDPPKSAPAQAFGAFVNMGVIHECSEALVPSNVYIHSR
jgi:hypothetical protein